MSGSLSDSRSRVVIPLTEALQAEFLDIAAEIDEIRGTGSQNPRGLCSIERIRLQHEELRRAVIAYSDVVAEIRHEWRFVDEENLPDE